jgi:hypothetical protein
MKYQSSISENQQTWNNTWNPHAPCIGSKELVLIPSSLSFVGTQNFYLVFHYKHSTICSLLLTWVLYNNTNFSVEF